MGYDTKCRLASQKSAIQMYVSIKYRDCRYVVILMVNVVLLVLYAQSRWNIKLQQTFWQPLWQQIAYQELYVQCTLCNVHRCTLCAVAYSPRHFISCDCHCCQSFCASSYSFNVSGNLKTLNIMHPSLWNGSSAWLNDMPVCGIVNVIHIDTHRLPIQETDIFHLSHIIIRQNASYWSEQREKRHRTHTQENRLKSLNDVTAFDFALQHHSQQ